MNKKFFSVIAIASVLLLVPHVSFAAFNFQVIDSSNNYYASGNSAPVAEDHYQGLYLNDTGGRTCATVATAAGLSESSPYWCLQTTVMGSLDLSCIFLCQNAAGPSGPNTGSNGGLNTYIFSSHPVGVPIDLLEYPYGCLGLVSSLDPGQSYYGCALQYHGPATAVTLTASPSSIYVGSASQLTWTSTNATSCTSSTFSVSNSATSGSASVSPTSTTTYSVTCTGPSGSATASASVDVSAVPTPTVALVATPSTINSGSASTLSWTSTNAVYCSSTQFDTTGATSGSALVSPSANTTYTISCTGSSSSTTGTWQYKESDISDFACPLTDPNKAYTSVQNCPVNPDGKSCTEDICKVNTISGCNINTSLYSCVGATSSTPPSVSKSVTVTVIAGPMSRACSVAPTSIYVNGTVLWSAVASGGSGSYSYFWSGTDSLSGIAATVSKQYSVSGTKTGSVSISDGNFPIEAQKECSGGTLYATDASTEDGVGFGLSTATIASTCANMTPKGGCCQLQVREYQSSTGQPISTYYTYKSYTGGSPITKNSYTAGAGSNTNVYNFYAGTERVDCSTNVVVSSNLPDLTPGALTPTSVTAGVSSTFALGVINSGLQATSVFGSTVYVCLATDTTCLNNPLASKASFFDWIIAFFGRFADAATSIKIPLSRISLTAGTSSNQTGIYTFTTSGAYKIRSCVDTPLNEVTEVNEDDNCSAWADFTVNPVVLNATCSVSPTSGYTNDNITWTATPSGGTGTYTYSWSGTDSLSGTTQSVVKQYTTIGTKTGSVTVTSGASSVTKSCSNSTSIAASPTALLSASPNVIIRGSGSSQLSWSSTNATSCTSTKFSTGGAASGNLTVTPSDTTTYDLTCTNAAKSAYSTAVVTVYVADLTLTVSPNTSVRRNDPATINWSVSGSPDSCLISGPGLSSTAFSGSQSVIVDQESTYTLSCTKDGATVSKSITVKLIPAFEEF